MKVSPRKYPWFVSAIRPRRIPGGCGVMFRRLVVEQLENRWLLSAIAVAKTQDTWSDPDCADEGGWADVSSNSSYAGNTSGQGGSAATSSTAAGSADPLQTKKPALAVLSTGEFAFNKSSDGGLVDLTPSFNRPGSTGDTALRSSEPALPEPAGPSRLPSSENAEPKDAGLATISAVRLNGLQGASQAFDVAMEPLSADASSPQALSPGLRSNPASEWPTPLPFPMRPGRATSPATSPLLDKTPTPANGETRFSSGAPLSATPSGLLPAVTANAQQWEDHAPSPHRDLSQDGKVAAINVEPSDRVFEQIAGAAKNLATAVFLNDRRVQTAIIAVAVATVTYTRWHRANSGDD